jgi:hypothetical protein
MRPEGSSDPPPPPPPPPLPPPDGGVGGLGWAAPGVGPDVTAAAQAAAPADAGAVDVALEGPMMTSALSIRLWLSVTVTRTVIEPEAGAMTVAVEVSAPTIAGGLVVGETTVQENDAIVRLQAAALAAALRLTFWPGATFAGRVTAAMGRSAASIEFDALTMPAPQVAVVHRHCSSWKS